MVKRVLILVAGVVIFLAVIGFIKVRQIQQAIAEGASMAPPPAAVTTYEVKAAEWQPVLEAVGTLRAVNGVMVSTDLPGVVSEITFVSGSPAKKGDILAKLDAKQEIAQLNASRARLDLARLNLERNKGLLSKRVASQSDYDSVAAEFKQAEASLKEIEAVIERKTLRAPFDGLLGIREVNLGQYVQSGSPVVQLESLDPIYVNFSLPQRNVGDLELGRKLHVTAEGFPGETFEGAITAIDPNVNDATRNIRAQATLANPKGRLRSGMFVQAFLQLPAQQEVIAIPGSAISYAPYGDSVFIVEKMKDKDGKEYEGVRQQFIKSGASRGDMIEVTSGLKAGDIVVSSGTFKLQNSAPIKVNNDVQPSADVAPTPEDS